jgi:hypothetical protein
MAVHKLRFMCALCHTHNERLFVFVADFVLLGNSHFYATFMKEFLRFLSRQPAHSLSRSRCLPLDFTFSLNFN